MRNDELKKDDVLRQYINARNIRKAPEGFSSKVMSHIYMEAKPVHREKTYIVPLVSAAIFLALILAAFLISDTSFILPELNIPGLNIPEFTIHEKLHFSFPELSGESVIPRTLIYIVCGTVAIAIFDFALNTIFRGEKNESGA